MNEGMLKWNKMSSSMYMFYTSIFFHIEQLFPLTKLSDNYPIYLLFLHIFKRRNFHAARYSQFHFVRKNLGCRPYGTAPLGFDCQTHRNIPNKDNLVSKDFLFHRLSWCFFCAKVYKKRQENKFLP